jgi:cytochrome c553
MALLSVLNARKAYDSRFFITLWLLAFSCFGRAGMIDKEGMQAWEICAMCHNANGISRMAKFPKLAGQKAAYIEQQILAFREGRRHNDGGQMQSIVGEVAQEDIAQISKYFSLLPPDAEHVGAGNEVSKSQANKLRQGQVLFQVGREGISACADCHANKKSNAPWLDGQHREYLEKQLNDFKSGDREAECSIAKPYGDLQKKSLVNIPERLKEAEIEALALFLSLLILERQ